MSNWCHVRYTWQEPCCSQGNRAMQRRVFPYTRWLRLLLINFVAYLGLYLCRNVLAVVLSLFLLLSLNHSIWCVWWIINSNIYRQRVLVLTGFKDRLWPHLYRLLSSHSALIVGMPAAWVQYSQHVTQRTNEKSFITHSRCCISFFFNMSSNEGTVTNETNAPLNKARCGQA